MEQNFQTSFIPKKSMVVERSAPSKPVSFASVISIFALFTMVLSSGGLYFYKDILNKNIIQMKKDLDTAKNRFELSKINQLQDLDKRLNASKDILARHIAISPVFKALQDVTMKTVRYTKFSYSLGDDKNTKITIKMSGVALGYRSVALQSDLFTENKHLIDPVFSNLTLDDKGNVLFDLTFGVSADFVDYKKMLSIAEPVN